MRVRKAPFTEKPAREPFDPGGVGLAVVFALEQPALAVPRSQPNEGEKASDGIPISAAVGPGESLAAGSIRPLAGARPPDQATRGRTPRPGRSGSTSRPSVTRAPS
jgi:hypothetical protein